MRFEILRLYLKQNASRSECIRCMYKSLTTCSLKRERLMAISRNVEWRSNKTEKIQAIAWCNSPDHYDNRMLITPYHAKSCIHIIHSLLQHSPQPTHPLTPGPTITDLPQPRMRVTAYSMVEDNHLALGLQRCNQSEGDTQPALPPAPLCLAL